MKIIQLFLQLCSLLLVVHNLSGAKQRPTCVKRFCSSINSSVASILNNSYIDFFNLQNFMTFHCLVNFHDFTGKKISSVFHDLKNLVAYFELLKTRCHYPKTMRYFVNKSKIIGSKEDMYKIALRRQIV